MRNEEVVMKKYKNWGIDMGGLSITDPVRYRKINAVLTEKGKKKDLLDMVENVPLEYVYDLADRGPSPEDVATLSELKIAATAALATLTPREERILRMRFGIGLNTDYTLEEIGQKFSVTRERIREIESKSLKLLQEVLNG
jgi:RNA polymerase sigma factor (sigma-70 family)|tara:strand:- start:121 stop:543 length:423 start_codon:yes stop_codon:yes gene_type:complete